MPGSCHIPRETESALIKSLKETAEIFGLEAFATVAAGALVEASSTVAVVLALIGRFWGCVARLPASRSLERVSSEANPAGAPTKT